MSGLKRRRLTIFDTTLRDGDQAAGYAFTRGQKIRIAHMLEDAGVDCVEAGFPQSSAYEAETCRIIASELTTSAAAVMTRARIPDIRASAGALAGAKEGILHLSLPVSRLHIRTKLGQSESDVLRLASEAVSYACGLVSRVEIGAEDATRADRNFLLDYCRAVTDSGANTVNIADTVGYAVPHEFAGLVRFLLEHVDAFRTGRSILSVHCHNDFGLANANTLSGITAGCGQIEVTCMGLGERAGNASLEEISAMLVSRSDIYQVETALKPALIERIPDVISRYIGTDLSPLKPVTGRNNRSHASGIHQHGIAANRKTYTPSASKSADIAGGNPDFDDEEAGPPERIVLSRHSGKAGLALALKKYTGFVPDDADLTALLEELKAQSCDFPTFGISELTHLLYERGLIKTPPWRCTALTVTEGNTPTDTRFSVQAAFAQTGKESKTFTKELTGSDWPQTIASLISSLFGMQLNLKTLSFSGYGPSTPAMRLYIEASTGKAAEPVYALERTGQNRTLLLVECLLDIVNSLSCLTATP